MTTKQPVSKLLLHISPWLGFAGFLLWGWRIYGIFVNIPTYGDVLEVAWGLRWYHDALFVQHVSPFFTPLIFFPTGWHTASLAHSPFIFLLGQPFYSIGGVAFAYNILVLIAFAVAFVGCLKFLRLYTPGFSAIIAALVYTFIGMRWVRILGHLHILWATSILPWLLWGLICVKKSSSQKVVSGVVIMSGIAWGIMINFSLYSLFFGAVAFLIWGPQLFRLVRIKQALLIAGIALGLATPLIILYLSASRTGLSDPLGLASLTTWGASINSLFIPSPGNPLAPIRQIAQSIYTGPADESGNENLGITTFVLAVTAIIVAAREKKLSGSIIWFTGVALVLSLGLFLRWNGNYVATRVTFSIAR